jgi:hypothetical protein
MMGTRWSTSASPHHHIGAFGAAFSRSHNFVGLRTGMAAKIPRLDALRAIPFFGATFKKIPKCFALHLLI